MKYIFCFKLLIRWNEFHFFDYYWMNKKNTLREVVSACAETRSALVNKRLNTYIPILWMNYIYFPTFVQIFCSIVNAL